MIRKGFITGIGINYAGTLPKVNKSENQLQPIFEAFTNSLEAIKIKQLEFPGPGLNQNNSSRPAT